MSSAPKCKICGANHGPGSPHAFSDPSAGKPPSKIVLGSPLKPDDRDMIIARQAAEIERLNRQLDPSGADERQTRRRTYMRELMRKRRAAARGNGS